MPKATYNCIATTTLGSDSASVTFSSISGSFTDLVIIVNARGSAAESMRMQFNADTSTNYSSIQLSDNAGTPVSARFENVSDIRIGYYQNGLSTTDFLPCIIQIQNYSNTVTQKSALGRSARQVVATAGLWRNTNAITEVKLYPASGNFISGSVFSVYGIKAE